MRPSEGSHLTRFADGPGFTRSSAAESLSDTPPEAQLNTRSSVVPAAVAERSAGFPTEKETRNGHRRH